MRKLTIVIGLTLALAACGKKGGVTQTTSATSSTAPAAEAKLDAALVDRAKAHAAGCTVVVESGQAYQCGAGIADATSALVREKKPADMARTLATLSRSKDDPKVAAAAAAILADQWDYLSEDTKRANATPAALEALVGAYAESPGPRASRLAKPLAHVATLAKSGDKAVAAIQAHSVKAARDEGYRNLLTFGRLDLFPAVKAAGASKEHARAALEAVRVMYKPTDAEKAAVCPWAQGFLGDGDGEVAAAAGYDMVYCRGAYVDALLTEATKRLDGGQYKNPFAMVMREPCFEMAGKLTPSAADVAQCDKVYAFLERAANDPKVDDATRGLALWNIYYQRRDDKTLKLMRRYENNANKEVSKRAKEAIKSLNETYKLKG